MKYFFVILIFMFSSSGAEIYKWTDENRKIHFGDRPVNKHKAEQLQYDTTSRAGITHSSGDNKERARMTKELETDRKERADKRAKTHAKKLKKQRRCAAARDTLKRQQNANSVYKLNSKGERVFYSAAQRAKHEKRYKSSIAKHCR